MRAPPEAPARRERRVSPAERVASARMSAHELAHRGAAARPCRTVPGAAGRSHRVGGATSSGLSRVEQVGERRMYARSTARARAGATCSPRRGRRPAGICAGRSPGARSRGTRTVSSCSGTSPRVDALREAAHVEARQVVGDLLGCARGPAAARACRDRLPPSPPGARAPSRRPRSPPPRPRRATIRIACTSSAP